MPYLIGKTEESKPGILTPVKYLGNTLPLLQQLKTAYFAAILYKS